MYRTEPTPMESEGEEWINETHTFLLTRGIEGEGYDDFTDGELLAKGGGKALILELSNYQIYQFLSQSLEKVGAQALLAGETDDRFEVSRQCDNCHMNYAVLVRYSGESGIGANRAKTYCPRCGEAQTERDYEALQDENENENENENGS